MIRIYVVGWLDENLTISRISFHDCSAAGLTRKFGRPPPVDLSSAEGATRKEAIEDLRETSAVMLGEKLAKMVLDALARMPW